MSEVERILKESRATEERNRRTNVKRALILGFSGFLVGSIGLYVYFNQSSASVGNFEKPPIASPVPSNTWTPTFTPVLNLLTSSPAPEPIITNPITQEPDAPQSCDKLRQDLVGQGYRCLEVIALEGAVTTFSSQGENEIPGYFIGGNGGKFIPLTDNSIVLCKGEYIKLTIGEQLPTNASQCTQGGQEVILINTNQ
jgi:hypothetical protein